MTPPSTPPPPTYTVLVIDTTAVTTKSGSVGTAAQFSTPTIEALRAQGHKVHILTYVPPAEVLRQADVVWSEWCNEAAYELAAGGHCRRLVLRMRGFEVFGPLDQMNWAAVHAIVHESPFLLQLTRERVEIPNNVRECVIPAGINLERFTFTPSMGQLHKPVALIARAIADKGYQLVLEWARRRPDVSVHVTTAMSEHNPRLVRYLKHAAPPNVHIYGEVDTAMWLQEIGARYVLSASTWESLGYTLIEGMAKGCIPLIHDMPTTAANWPGEYVWRSFKDLDRLYDRGFTDAELAHNRAWVETHFDSIKQTEKFAKVLFDDLSSVADDADDASTFELTPITGNEAEVLESLLDNDALSQAIQIFQRWAPASADPLVYAQLAMRIAQMAFVEGEHVAASRIALRALEQDSAQAHVVLNCSADVPKRETRKP